MGSAFIYGGGVFREGLDTTPPSNESSSTTPAPPAPYSCSNPNVSPDLCNEIYKSIYQYGGENAKNLTLNESTTFADLEINDGAKMSIITDFNGDLLDYDKSFNGVKDYKTIGDFIKAF
jgi:hypothetical protein